MSKVLGLTGKESVVEVENTTSCSLCKRLLHRGEDAVEAAAGWLIHPDCGVALLVKGHSIWFREEVKAKNPKRRTRGQKKRIHESEGNQVCCFCHNLISLGQTFVKEDKKPLHNEGRNSCAVRYRRVVNATKSSVN